MLNRRIITQLVGDSASEETHEPGETLPTPRRPSRFPFSRFVLFSVLSVLSPGEIGCGALNGGPAKTPDDKVWEVDIPKVPSVDEADKNKDSELEMPSKQELPLCNRNIRENCRVEHYSDQLESDLDK